MKQGGRKKGRRKRKEGRRVKKERGNIIEKDGRRKGKEEGRWVRKKMAFILKQQRTKHCPFALTLI